jgi:hypothetical protein
MSFGTWNVRSLYRIGSQNTVASELAKHKLNLLAVLVSDGTVVLMSQQVKVKLSLFFN